MSSPLPAATAVLPTGHQHRRAPAEVPPVTVLDAGDLDEAVALSPRHPGPILLLLTDVVLPGMGGRHVAERILAISPGLSVVYMSGYTDDAIVHHGVLDPRDRVIEKSITANTPLRKLRRFLA